MFLLLSLGEDLASDRAKNQWRTEGEASGGTSKRGGGTCQRGRQIFRRFLRKWLLKRSSENFRAKV